MCCTCQDLAGQRLELERQLCSWAPALGEGGWGGWAKAGAEHAPVEGDVSSMKE